MRYAFHGHRSSLDLAHVVRFAPELAAAVARAQGEDDPEEALAFELDLFGAAHVAQQRDNLAVILRRWAHLAPRARTLDEQERVRAIPERLAWRFDAVWPEGRAALHLVLRAVTHRTGCSMPWAPLCVEEQDMAALLSMLEDGLRAGFAASVDADLALDVLKRARDRATSAPPARHAPPRAPATDEDAGWIELTTQL